MNDYRKGLIRGAALVLSIPFWHQFCIGAKAGFKMGVAEAMEKDPDFRALIEDVKATVREK